MHWFIFINSKKVLLLLKVWTSTTISAFPRTCSGLCLAKHHYSPGSFSRKLGRSDVHVTSKQFSSHAIHFSRWGWEGEENDFLKVNASQKKAWLPTEFFIIMMKCLIWQIESNCDATVAISELVCRRGKLNQAFNTAKNTW